MSLVKDVQFGWRGMRKNLGFTIVAVATLAIAIGANSAIFSIVNAVLIRSLPYDHSERIVQMWESHDKFQGTASWPNFQDWRTQSSSFEALSAYTRGDVTLLESTSPERLKGAFVTADFFHVFGTPTVIGRTFALNEDQPSAPATAVISESLWKSHFAADKSVLGKTLTINGEPRTIIGVVPAWHRIPANVEVWIPLVPKPDVAQQRGNHFMFVAGRLKPNVSFAQAQEEMKVIAQRLAQQYPDEQAKRTVLLVPMQEQLVGQTRPTLIALLVAVGFVLLIACANVANLLLARVTGRRKEIAIRTALGASRSQLIRQFLVESCLLSVFAGLIGIVIAKIGMASLVAWAAPFLPRASEVSLDWRVIIFSLILATLTGILCGVVPAWQSSKADPQSSLKQGGTTSGPQQSSWLTGTLAIAEVAAAIILLIGAGLMIHTISNLQQQDPGFQTQNITTFKISLSDKTFDSKAASRFFDDVIDRVSALPGVKAAGAITFLPTDQFGWNGDLTVQGVPKFDNLAGAIERRYISGNYFRSMNIPLLKGRFMEKSDLPSGARVVLINQTLAKMIEPYGDPVGKLVLGDTDADSLTIIGVVGDVHQKGLNAPALPEIYIPHENPWQSGQGAIRQLAITVRTDGNPGSLMTAIRNEVAHVDPNQAIYDVRSMQTVVENSYTNLRFTRTLVTLFALLGTILAVVGVYSVLAYLVSQHTREIGIRVAVGAQTSHIVRMVLSQGAIVGAIGVALGLFGAFGLTRLISAMLFGVKAFDPGTFVGASALLFMVVLVACCVPAWRATRVDPMIVLRQE